MKTFIMKTFTMKIPAASIFDAGILAGDCRFTRGFRKIYLQQATVWTVMAPARRETAL